MIFRYRFGTPYDTDAVVLDLPEEKGDMRHFRVIREGKKVTLQIRLAEEDLIFGLGESVRGMNKRGYRYQAWNSDEFNHTEDRQSLYGSHNLLVFFGPEKCFGLYLDDPGRVFYDLGFTCMEEAAITSENGDLNVYLLEENSLKEIARSFRRLTGRSYVPPRWAMGYIQSRWGYASEEEVRNVTEEHRKRGIPLDAVCLDIDYMDDFRNFTWRKEAFPDLKGFQQEAERLHVHLVPIIDAGIRQEEGYAAYDSGKAADAFCKKEDGTDFTASVWPGRCCFPDFMRPEVRAWFGDLYRPLLEAGVEGFWNDMNEPALFFTDESLNKAFQLAEQQRNTPDDYEGMWNLKGAFNGMANNPEDYRSFYHQINGKTVRHDRIHNLYGAGMTRATAEGFRRFRPDRRFLLFSRSSFIGAHRNGGIWQGDNFSWWEHLKLAVHMLPNLNLCGFLFSGCDLGGFGCDATEDLLIRFLQLGVFTPLMRNHSALHTRDQEIYRFSIWERMRDVVTVRYALLPYLYSELMKAALSDGMYFRPLAFDYPEDSRACYVEDQLMLGEDCMIAPVCEQNASGRYVYLPEDMLMIRFRSAEDYDMLKMQRGDHFIRLKLHEFPLFVKKNRLLLLCPGGQYTDELRNDTFRVLGWTPEPARYRLYRDDGLTTQPSLEGGLTDITLTRDGLLGQGLCLRSLVIRDP